MHRLYSLDSLCLSPTVSLDPNSRAYYLEIPSLAVISSSRESVVPMDSNSQFCWYRIDLVRRSLQISFSYWIIFAQGSLKGAWLPILGIQDLTYKAHLFHHRKRLAGYPYFYLLMYQEERPWNDCWEPMAQTIVLLHSRENYTTRELYRLLRIQVAASTAWDPQFNGQTECMNQELGQYIRLFVNERQSNWYDLLALAKFHSTTTMCTCQPGNPLSCWTPDAYRRWALNRAKDPQS